MKMRNDDIKKITEIKQYLLNPPASFRLYEYAPNYLRDAIAVLNRYPETKELVNYLQNLAEQFENKQIDKVDLLKILKESGAAIGKLTNK